MPRLEPRPVTVTWWHLEALAARLQELLPDQLELAWDVATEAAERAAEAPGAPGAPSRPTDSLGTAPGPSQSVEDPERAQGGTRREPKARQQATQERPEGDWSEVDIALWPLLYGPNGIWPAGRRGRRL